MSIYSCIYCILSNFYVKQIPYYRNYHSFFPLSNQIDSLWARITFKVGTDRIKPFSPTGHELPLLDRDMDQQIVDTEGRRLVRVNDLQLARVGEKIVLIPDVPLFPLMWFLQALNAVLLAILISLLSVALLVTSIWELRQ